MANKPLTPTLTGVQLRMWAYRSASNILHKPRVPAFVQPGDNNITDCNDVLNAEELWTKYFRRIDGRWDHDFEVT